MSAFEDYCIVCEKACDDGSAYCSQLCKESDQQNLNSPTISIISNSLPSINGSFTLENSKSHSNSISSSSCHYNHNHNHNHNHCNNVNCTVPKILSPLLTPQISTSFININNNINNISINNSNNINNNNNNKSPTLTYESPLLISTTLNSNSNFLNDLDSNRLDLNSSNIQHSNSITERLNKTLKKQQPKKSQQQQQQQLQPQKQIPTQPQQSKQQIEKENNTNVTDVSNMLRSSSENYKKWLSIH
ncbi:hypothetical protein C6P40_003348 [Pichia californica]|uniref:Uncharacterized protein n=1 Tax=Pichia californica TaxID=460514 RepID=A0A9P6WHF3_9ASCO|nr:hypothetical protein C6P40_003348 [[Candida] californica]